jgi:hypothetical protein
VASRWPLEPAVAAPDCYQKSVILVNGQFQATTIEVKQGDILMVRMPLAPRR